MYEVEKALEELVVRLNSDIARVVDDPYTWTFTKDSTEYQGEVIGVWEDSDKSVLRLIGYASPVKAHWWNNFFTKSSYEKIIRLKD